MYVSSLPAPDPPRARSPVEAELAQPRIPILRVSRGTVRGRARGEALPLHHALRPRGARRWRRADAAGAAPRPFARGCALALTRGACAQLELGGLEVVSTDEPALVATRLGRAELPWRVDPSHLDRPRSRQPYNHAGWVALGSRGHLLTAHILLSSLLRTLDGWSSCESHSPSDTSSPWKEAAAAGRRETKVARSRVTAWPAEPRGHGA